jgi:DNA-binding MarR family transcriptional regulator
MPELSSGFTGEYRAIRLSQQVDLGKGLESLITAALPDFTHMTVLLYLMRQAKDAVSASDVAAATGDPKAAIQAVLDRFEKLELVRCSQGLLGRKYAFHREGPRSELAIRLLKLWEHPQSHEVILRKIFAGKAPGGAGPQPQA